MKPKNEFVLEVSELMKRYPGVQAVDGITFNVRKGEIFGMLGPNGAGKTTTIECVEGLRHPDEGKIQVLGLDPHKKGHQLKERIGIQCQSAALPNRIKVWETMDLFASFYQKSIDWRHLLAKMGLEDKRDAFVSKLSGGQKQRVFIALALINDPEIVFLDELTTGLDPQGRRAMWDLIREIQSQGKTIFLTTHFMEEAERLCDRVAIVDHGKMIALDTPKNLVESLGEESRVLFDAGSDFHLTLLNSLPGVSRVERIGEGVVVYGKKEGLISKVANALEAAGVTSNNIRSEQPNLEDVFLKLTGNEIRN